MWSLFLTGFNAILSPGLLQNSVLATQPKILSFAKQYIAGSASFKTSQISLVEAVSSKGFLLKYSPNWQRYAPQNSNPNSDIFLARSFTSPQGEIIVKVTTTAMKFMGVPKKLPPNIKKIDVSSDLFARVLSQSGYKINERTELKINEKKGVKLVTETPKKLGSTILLIEGKDDTMVVSTAIYPIDSSIISPELLEQVLTEIGLIQNSITIRS